MRRPLYSQHHQPKSTRPATAKHTYYVYIDFPGIDCLSLELQLHAISFSCFFAGFADFVQRLLLLLVFLLGCAYFFLFLPQTKFAKLGVSTTRTASAKAHKKGTIPINLTLPDPVLERVPKFCYCSTFFAMLMHVAAYDTFTPPLSVVDPS